MEEKIFAELAEIKQITALAAKRVLNLEEVCQLTGLGKSHVYRLTSIKEIPHYKPNGKLLYFDRAEVEAWMKQNRVATREEITQKAVVALARKEAGV